MITVLPSSSCKMSQMPQLAWFPPLIVLSPNPFITTQPLDRRLKSTLPTSDHSGQGQNFRANSTLLEGPLECRVYWLSNPSSSDWKVCPLVRIAAALLSEFQCWNSLESLDCSRAHIASHLAQLKAFFSSVLKHFQLLVSCFVRLCKVVLLWFSWPLKPRKFWRFYSLHWLLQLPSVAVQLLFAVAFVCTLYCSSWISLPYLFFCWRIACALRCFGLCFLLFWMAGGRLVLSVIFFLLAWLVGGVLLLFLAVGCIL